MSRLSSRTAIARVGSAAPAVLLLGLLVLPFATLALASKPADLAAGLHHPLFLPALWLTARTTVLSLLLVVVMGTPLAWWLATGPRRRTRVVEALSDLPIVVPPAVVGIALLTAFGREGPLAPALSALHLGLPFTTTAVVLAQVVVSAPFYVRAATTAFRKVDLDLMLVARTLGASPAGAFVRVAVPVALPGLLAGAALAWARAIGEFGATLLFAGSLTGTTQTMPLAIYAALEVDVRAAIAISLVLAAIAVVLLVVLRALPGAVLRRRGGIAS